MRCHHFVTVLCQQRAITCSMYRRMRLVCVLLPPVSTQIDDMGRRRVWAVMKSGDRWEGDILVGADGIYSKASHNLKCAAFTDTALL